MNQTDETDQSHRPAFVMSYQAVIQDSEDQDTYREETVTLTFTNPQGLSIPDSEWQCNADFLLCEYGIPGMAPNGKMSDWIASDCPMIEKLPGKNEPNENGPSENGLYEQIECYVNTLTAIQFTEMGETASVMGKVMLRIVDPPMYGEKEENPQILATADVLLTLANSPENRAALMKMVKIVEQPGNP